MLSHKSNNLATLREVSPCLLSECWFCDLWRVYRCILYGELHSRSYFGLILGQGRQSEEIKRQLLMMAPGQPLSFSPFLAYLAALLSFAVWIISFSLYFQFPCLGIHHETFGILGRRNFRNSRLWIKLGEREKRLNHFWVWVVPTTEPSLYIVGTPQLRVGPVSLICNLIC